ncbi:uncharacterized protein BKCO1_8000188 [Diplodia corticola]|uniref:DUF1917-domain-containing protein n=1 Tax=Diplodia corticola TaxID=236234 RepID=A0A1J9SC63_9PEZI|nr:uncharacterized protein BKCO1_8000188 [Diplodia corticola]OJD37173.1 hypothetical protein BKCO1_8000188 [Diplodia corticola]
MPPSEALVSGQGWISDESSFYGDDETVDALEKRSGSLNVSEYWSAHESLASTIASKARARTRPSSTLNGAKQSGETDEIAYPNDGEPKWYQSSETVSEFLKRCPPDTTVFEETGIEWFWVDNPHKPAQSKDKPNSDAFEEAGKGLLETYRKKREGIEKSNPGLRKGAVTSRLLKDRIKLKQQIAELARETHVVCGKWLLFPHWDDVPRLWKQVCLAVLENRLGPCAKVATKSANKNDPCGVIVIYTRDCFDIHDVRRVLLALVDLGLVSDRDDARKIWYKMDAYTYLQLNSGNEYNLPASLYSSKDMLKSEGSASKRKVDEMHSPQSNPKGKQRSIADMFR